MSNRRGDSDAIMSTVVNDAVLEVY